MLTCADPELDKKFRLWRQHGMSVPDTVRHQSPRVIFESYAQLGYNYRLTDIQAAVGRQQLQRLPEIVSQRRLLAARYRRLLAGIPGLRVPEEPAWARTNWQSFWVELAPEYPQTQIMQALLDAGVATRRGIMCAHLEPAYEIEPWACGQGPDCRGPHPGCGHLQESEKARDHSIILPLYPQMTFEEQDYVVEALQQTCSLARQEHAGEPRTRRIG
jgi:dTDP-4-amino-4,6-dideoxygalactose transaminase